jgi:hypothetical protein
MAGMGIDALDIVFRLEKAFDVRIPAETLYWSDTQRLKRFANRMSSVTVADVHQRVCDLLVEMKLPVPDDSWERVTRCIGGALSIPPSTLRPGDRLIEDLAAS